MEGKDIVIPQDKSKLVHAARGRVKELFEVEVAGSRNNKKNWKNCEDFWINLKGSAENINNAQTYINALCAPQIEREVEFPSELLSKVQEKCRQLEKRDCVYISFLSKNKARIQGQDLESVITQSELEDFIKNFPCASSEKRQPAPLTEPKLESRLDPYKSISSGKVTESQDLTSLKDTVSKLGYSEEDLQAVIRKLGPKFNIDQLLEQLIQVQSSARMFREDKTNRTISPVYSQGYASSSGVVGNAQPRTDIVPRGDIVARGAPCAMPDRGGVISRGSSTALRLDSDYRSFDEREERVAVPALDGLRPIVIDGSNVAMSHGNQKIFSCRGIKLCLDWFLLRGHKEIFIFVPSWRKEAPNPENVISNQEILYDLEQRGYLKYTPARRVNGRRVVCYDDRYIIKLASEIDGIVVSNDRFRDLMNESEKFKEVIEKRLLMFSFVNDYFLPPDDPLGRFGPSLDELLQKGTESSPRICPFHQMKKCTYGARCRYYHPDRDAAVVKKPDFAAKPAQTNSSLYSGASRDQGLPLSRGHSQSMHTHPALHGVNIQGQDPGLQGVNVRGQAEPYRESYSRGGAPQYPYNQMYGHQQYVMPNPCHMMPRGHPQMMYPPVYPHTGYVHTVPQMDYIPARPPYPGNYRENWPVEHDAPPNEGQQQFKLLFEWFPQREEEVRNLIQNHPDVVDINELAEYLSTHPPRT